MGFLHNKKKTTSASASPAASKDRFNEKKSYENLYDEYNKPSKAKASTPTKQIEESRDEEPTTNRRKDKKTAKAEVDLDALVESSDDPNPHKKSPIKEITPIKKKKKRTTSRRRRQAFSDSESEDSFSSVSSSESEEETDLSYEESYTEDEVSETSTNLESFSIEEEEKADPNHQAVVQVNEHGNVEKLRLEVLRLVPKATTATSVVIKIEASSITLQDCMIRRGKWYDMQSLPFIPGSDVVGTIHEIGDEAARTGGYQIGDRVAAVVPAGGNAKYITLNYDQIIRVPDGTDPVVALSLSSTYVPAREALDLARKMNTPYTGANILVIGGNGPSGLATIELAGLEGANVFTTADERHHEFLTELGAKCFPIDPKKWLPTLKGKMDVVIDSVCLDGFESSALALNDGGILVCTGMSALYTQGNIPAFGLRDIRDMKAVYVKLRAKYLMRSVYYDKMERFNSAPNEYAVSIC